MLERIIVALHSAPRNVVRECGTESAVCLSQVEQRGQVRTCNPAAMPQSKGQIPEFLPTSPMSLLCPTCMSMPGRDCITTSGRLSAPHAARIKAAASADNEKKSSGGRE
jgi:hypothetical protein